MEFDFEEVVEVVEVVVVNRKEVVEEVDEERKSGPCPSPLFSLSLVFCLHIPFFFPFPRLERRKQDFFFEPSLFFFFFSPRWRPLRARARRAAL